MKCNDFRRFRSSGLLLIAAVVLLFANSPARGMYMRPDLVEVPVDRLVANLTKLVEANPEDGARLLNLARLHGMAYAQKSDTARAWRGREDRGAWYGYEPKHVPFSAKPTDDPAKQAAALAHLQKASAIYAKAIAAAPDNLAAQLGYGWCLAEAGKKDEAVVQLRKTAKAAWAKEKNSNHAGLGARFFTTEAASYLIPLLDKTGDAAEIATLGQRTKKLMSLPRPITPIAVPLVDGLGAADLIDREARVSFDADGSGRRRTWTWITPEAGWLVLDRHETGRIDSALQMFGNVSFWLFWNNGYEALGALDDNADGQLTGGELRGLAIWRDANGNGRSEAGEVRSLAAWRIEALSCRFEIDASHPDRIAFSPAGVTFSDGTLRATYDVILHRDAPDRRAGE
ncbi:MAG: hypothetical protein HQ581_24680 [Planctomycetes bacterium]|nr:hypothetical protein [Planctomycetota bacterium]